MGDANPAFHTTFGVLVVYTPLGGSAIPGTPRTIQGIVEPPNADNIREGNVALQYTQRSIWISSRNDTEGVVTPKVRGDVDDGGGDTLTIDGDSTVWYVMGVDSSEPGMHRLDLVDNDGAI